MIYFTSDYTAGTHPEILERLQATNLLHTAGYGSDPYTRNAATLIRQECGLDEDVAVHFLVGGTQTNATVIDGLLARHEGVIAAESGHIAVHESGAIEASGHKVLTLPHHDGKLRAEEVEHYIDEFYRDETYEHMVAPGMVYISFPTEFGTIYSLEELESLSKVCHSHSIPLYIDGARLAYGLAAEGCDVTIKDIARLADVFYIGGTKAGTLFGEAVVVPNRSLLPHFFPLIKQHGALLAKGRLLGVQFEALFTNDLFGRIGRHAVELATRLRSAMVSRGYRIAVESPTNQQFFILPNEVVDRLSKEVSMEYWGPRGESESTVRFVTSWATTAQDVEQLIELL